MSRVSTVRRDLEWLSLGDEEGEWMRSGEKRNYD
jgi:hypothetical protein